MFNFPCRRPTVTEVTTVMNIARITVVFVTILVLTCEVQSISKRRALDAPMLKVLRNIKEILDPCPSGWTHFKSYCYFVSSAVKSWQDARTYCKSKGGDLVKIHSDEENEFVLNLVYKHAPSTKQVWIGLKWDALISKFIWADEARTKYTNRDNNEPSGNASEPCGNMWTGTWGHGNTGYWNDLSCLNRVYPCGLVCKRLP